MKLLLNIIFLLSLSLNVTAQSNKQIEKESSRLSSLRKSIDKLEAEILKNDKNQKNSVKFLQNIDEKILLLNDYIRELEKEERRISRNVKVLEKKIKENENEIIKLKNNFTKLVIWYYKYGQQSEFDLLLTSGTMNDAMSKIKYLKIISEETKKTIINLRKKRKQLTSDKNKLVLEKKGQQRLLASKKKEKKILLRSKAERKKLLAKLRKNKNSLLVELKNKRKAEQKIEEKIAELIRIENERLANQNAAKEELKEFANYNLSEFENFNELRGRLNWPVKKGKITRKFGKQRNLKLNTTTINYGIDIKTERNSLVKAVAGGVVSVIDWIPGYGSVLILTHKNGYRTVYGHLTDIQVVQGDKVNAGIILGKVNESLEGNILHFEIWKQRQNQNPEKWLVRK